MLVDSLREIRRNVSAIFCHGASDEIGHVNRVPVHSHPMSDRPSISERRRLAAAFTYTQARAGGISAERLYAYRDQGLIDRVARGLCRWADAPEIDLDLLEISRRARRGHMDTNHLEHALRAIPMGRRNWLFCWTELGARQVGIAQSLLTTCRLHEINPYDYLVDVLQRVGQHPASRVEELTPRLWKRHFADHPLRSDLQDVPH